MIQLGRLGREASFDIAQAFPVGELCKSQDTKQFGTRKCANTVISIVSRHDPVKGFPRKKVHDLCKQRLSGVHRTLSALAVCQEEILPESRSSRGHPRFAVTYCDQWKNSVLLKF